MKIRQIGVDISQRVVRGSLQYGIEGKLGEGEGGGILDFRDKLEDRLISRLFGRRFFKIERE